MIATLSEIKRINHIAAMTVVSGWADYTGATMAAGTRIFKVM